MTASLLISALIGYVLSTVAGLILLVTGKGMPRRAVTWGVLIHAGLAVMFLAGLAGLLPGDWIHVCFLVFCCTGMILSGLAMRGRIRGVLRVYFILYACSLVLFVASPSTLVRYITWHPVPAGADRLRVTGNIYLERQKALLPATGPQRFKLVQEFGIFHKTLERDLEFDFHISSLRLLEYRRDTLIRLRAYGIQAGVPDSADVSSDLVPDAVEKVRIEKR